MKKLFRISLCAFFALLLFACEDKTSSLYDCNAYPATKSAYAGWFPRLEYDERRPYTCVVTYWASEMIYRAGIMSQEEAWALPFEDKIMLIEDLNARFEDEPEGTAVDKSLGELYAHMYSAIHNYPGMDFQNTNQWDLMYDTEEYPYVMCKLEAMKWKEFGRPGTGLDENDNGSGTPSGQLPPVTEFPELDCARYTPHLLWRNATVRYRYSREFEKSSHVSHLEKAMEDWRRASDFKLTFKRMKNNFWNQSSWAIGVNYHSYVDAKHGMSYTGMSTLGMVPWAILYFDDDAWYSRTYQHELGHTLGLIHEHQRPDRDDYINVFIKDIPIGSRSQYWKCITAKTFGQFDFKSVMLYTPGLRGGVVAMRKKDGSIWRQDDVKCISDGDIAGIRELYK